MDVLKRNAVVSYPTGVTMLNTVENGKSDKCKYKKKNNIKKSGPFHWPLHSASLGTYTNMCTVPVQLLPISHVYVYNGSSTAVVACHS